MTTTTVTGGKKHFEREEGKRVLPAVSGCCRRHADRASDRFLLARCPCKHSVWGPISCRTESVQAWGLDIPSLLDEVLASMGFGDKVHASIALVMTPTPACQDNP